MTRLRKPPRKKKRPMNKATKKNKRRSSSLRTKQRMPTMLLRLRGRRPEARAVIKMPKMPTTPPRLNPLARIWHRSRQPSRV